MSGFRPPPAQNRMLPFEATTRKNKHEKVSVWRRRFLETLR